MQPRYTVDVKKADVDEVSSLLTFVGVNADNALRIAINKTLPITQTAASKAIRKEVKIKAKDVGPVFKKTWASRAKLEGRLKTKGRGRLLSKYSTDPTIRGDKMSLLVAPPVPTKGIRLEVSPGQRKTLQGSREAQGKPFFLILPNSHKVAIAQRRNKPGAKGGQLKILYGPSISQVFNSVKADVGGEDILQDKVLEATNYLLRKKHPV